MIIMSRTFYLLLLLAPHGVLLTSQTRELNVTFIRPEFPTVMIKADCDPSLGQMIIQVYKCPMNGDRYPQPWGVQGVCEEDGGKHCLTQELQDEDCFAISGYFPHESFDYISSELSLANVTFLSNNFTVHHNSWKQQGNTSVLHLKPLAGVSIYSLTLKDASNKENGNCSTVNLTGDTEGSLGDVVFTAHWHQQVVPGCTYKVLFEPKNECDDNIAVDTTNLPMLQYVQPSKEVILVEEPKNGKLFVAEVVTAALLTLLVMMLLFVFIYHARKSRRIPCEPQRLPLLTGREATPSPRPAVLLVYAPNLHPQMATLGARLEEMTGLQIEDLHDVGDQDKLSDPTVWVTRRLMDANTRFVLPCTTVHHDNNEETSQEHHGGAIHFLLDDFLQQLRSSSLAYDYTRLHLVSFEDEPQVEVRDVTPGRVYQLPAHLPQLAQNLTLATHPTITSPSDTVSASW